MEVNADDLHNIISTSSSVILLDVREKIEFHTYNIGGINMPLSNFLNSIEDAELDKEEKIYVICQHGIRSKTAQQILIKAGYLQVINVKGGITSYHKKYAEKKI